MEQERGLEHGEVASRVKFYVRTFTILLIHDYKRLKREGAVKESERNKEKEDYKLKCQEYNLQVAQNLIGIRIRLRTRIVGTLSSSL